MPLSKNPLSPMKEGCERDQKWQSSLREREAAISHDLEKGGLTRALRGSGRSNSQELFSRRQVIYRKCGVGVLKKQVSYL